ncbi:Uncharacterized protein Rs2_38252 [Raphanus sativus]|nr:Uncharacterized protein Rs2_38252 [Raphanus sativus]
MVSQSDLIRQGGSSSARRLDLTVEDEIIHLPPCDLSTAAERFKRTLIGRVLHRGGRSVGAMMALLPRARIWNVEGRVRGVNLGNGCFQFDFDKEEDLVMVLNKRPCHLNHWIFALERWEPSTSANFPNTVSFWIKVTGVPVHFWNDQTFEEIAKALGTRLNLDSTNARLQVSINADRPLQFERRVGFPNGDTGKVHFEYEGLSRPCFGCNRITHDIHSCPELTQEERDQKIKEYRELDKSASLPQHLRNRSTLSTRNNSITNKRPRSPSDDGIKRSPGRQHHPGFSRGEKRRKDSGSYWSTRNYEDHRVTTRYVEGRQDHKFERPALRNEPVWNRLETRPKEKTREVSISQYQSRGQNRAREVPRYRSNDRYPAPNSRHSQRVWRPRSPMTVSRNNTQIRSVALSGNQALETREGTDSQRTLSEAPPRRENREARGNGVMVVHRDETPEERMRRIKGKAPMTAEALEKTPMSAEKGTPSGLLLRDRGIIRIREAENSVMPQEPSYKEQGPGWSPKPGMEGDEQAEQPRGNSGKEETTPKPAGERNSSLKETELTKRSTILQNPKGCGYC